MAMIIGNDNQVNQMKLSTVNAIHALEQNKTENLFKDRQLGQTDRQLTQAEKHQANQEKQQATELALRSTEIQNTKAYHEGLLGNQSAELTLKKSQLELEKRKVDNEDVPKEVKLLRYLQVEATKQGVSMPESDMYKIIVGMKGKKNVTQEEVAAAIIRQASGNVMEAKKLFEDPTGYAKKANTMAATIILGLKDTVPSPGADGKKSVLDGLDGADLGL